MTLDEYKPGSGALPVTVAEEILDIVGAPIKAEDGRWLGMSERVMWLAQEYQRLLKAHRMGT